jgi:MFS family permease
MVAVALIGISTGPAAFGLASIGLFIDQLQRLHGWSRTEISAAVSIMMVCTAFSLPLVGRLIDRFGIHRVMVPSIIAMGLCLIAIPFVGALWQFIAIYIGIGTLAAGSNAMGYLRALASWFDRSRGLAIGIAGSGTGLGFAYVPIVTQYLVDSFGWAAGYYGLGLIMLCVTLPLVTFFLREAPPEVQDNLVDSPAIAAGKSVSEAMATRDFWLLGAIFVTASMALYGLIPHLVPLLTDRGFSLGVAAQVASAFGLATFGGRVLIGYLVDKFDARRIALIFLSLSALSLPLLAFELPIWAVLLAGVLLGGSLGAEVDMLAYLTSRYFGLRCFAQIYGILMGAVMLAMAVGPVLFGAVHDHSGSYMPLLILGVPICGMAALLTLALRPYAERKRGGPVSSS